MLKLINKPNFNSVDKISYLQVFLIAFSFLGFELISYLPENLHVDSRIVTIPFRALYVMICIIILIHLNWIKNVKLSNLYIIIIIFWVYYFLRAVYDLLFDPMPLKTSPTDFLLFAFVLSLLPIFPFMLKINLNTLNRAKFVLFLFAIVVNVLGFLNNYQSLKDENVGRFLGNEILNPISYGQAGVVLVILCITYFFDQNILRKIFLIGLIAFGIANIALAASRGPMIQLAIVVLFFVLFNLKKIGYKNIILLFGALISIAIYFSDYLVFFDTVISRIEETGLNNGSGNEERYLFFKGALNQFLSNPFFGDFIEERRFGGYPHNIILESLMVMGIIGGALFLYIYVSSIKNALALIKIEITSWIGLMLTMQLIAALTSGSLYSSFSFWALIALSENLSMNKGHYKTIELNQHKTTSLSVN